MDERLNNFKRSWPAQQTTLIDMWDYIGRTTIPLNYNESDWQQQGDDDIEKTMSFKKIVLIPLHSANTAHLEVPYPQLQSADIFILEMPVPLVVDMDTDGQMLFV